MASPTWLEKVKRGRELVSRSSIWLARVGLQPFACGELLTKTSSSIFLKALAMRCSPRVAFPGAGWEAGAVPASGFLKRMGGPEVCPLCMFSGWPFQNCSQNLMPSVVLPSNYCTDCWAVELTRADVRIHWAALDSCVLSFKQTSQGWLYFYQNIKTSSLAICFYHPPGVFGERLVCF